MKGRPWTPAEEARLWSLHAQGWSWDSIAKALNRSRQACSTRLCSLGVPQEEDYPVSEECLGTDSGKRKCHDCGRPTYDYRCARCRRKWQIRNDAPSDAEIQNMYVD